MILKRSFLPASLLMLTVLAFQGCSSESGSSSGGTGLPAARDGLQDLSALLQSLDAEGVSVPSSAAQFRQFDVVNPAAGIMIPNGSLVYFQGGKIDLNSTSRIMVAMQADADQSGGWVLLDNGDLEELAASEVQALKPAGKPIK